MKHRLPPRVGVALPRLVRVWRRHAPAWTRLLVCVISLTLLTTWLVVLPAAPAAALTATLVPDSDVTAQWTVLGGTEDATCAGGTHCDRVDEGTTLNATDYVSTGTALGSGIVEEFGLTTTTGVTSARQVRIYVAALSATNANGGTLDTVGINLRVGGALQTAVTIRPAHSTTYTWYSATFTGTWTHAEVDGMQAYLVRNVTGSGGSAGNHDDDIRVAALYAELTYTGNSTFEQSAYRFYSNTDASSGPTFGIATGTPAQDLGHGTEQTSDGGYVSVGTVSSGAAGGKDLLLTRFDDGGNPLWSSTWGGSGTEEVGEVAVTSDGGFAVAGATNSFGAGLYDMFLVRYDSTGTWQWSRTWGGTGTDTAYAVAQTQDGGLAVVGHTSSYGSGSSDIIVLKYDSAGTLAWARTWGGAGSDWANSVVANPDGGVTLTGSTSSYGGGGSDVVALRLDASGTVSWARVWGGSGTEEGHFVIRTGDGGYAVAAQMPGSPSGTDSALLRLDDAGAITWATSWPGVGDDIAGTVRQVADGGFALSGRTTGYGNGSAEMYLARFDSSGTLLWSRTWGTSEAEEATGLVATSDGGYTIGGYGKVNQLPEDFLLVKFNSDGTVHNCGTTCTSPSVTSNTVNATNSTVVGSTTTPTGTTTEPSGVTASPTSSSTVVTPRGPAMAVGAPLAAANTAATAPADGTPFRVRLGLHVDAHGFAPDDHRLKLQVAQRGGDGSCDTAFSGETYADVNPDSGLVRFYNNPNAVDGQLLTSDANDPSHNGHTNVLQSYEERNNFTATATIEAGQDGLWDFALVTSSAPASTAYCLRAVRSDGSVLDSYSTIAQFTTPGTGSNTAPNSATALDQRTAGNVSIATGAWHNNGSVTFTASVSDPDASDTLALCVETDVLATAFSGAEDACGTGVAYSGTAVTASVTRTLTESEYHWQVRVKDAAGAYSGWVSFGGNLETARDVGIDTTAPTAGTVYDGSDAGVDKAFNNGSLTSLSGNWAGYSDKLSGLGSYDYAVGTTAGGTEILTWTPNALTTSASPTGLTLSTSVLYYLSVRATDNAGNTITATSNGQQVVPALGFTLTGLGSGATCGPHTTNVAATSSVLDLRLASASQHIIGGLDLAVTTNAAAGYTVTTSYTTTLAGATTARTYTDVAGTNTTPVSWPATGTEAFGYSTSSNSLPGGTANRFAGGLWAAFTTTFAPVAHLATPATGTDTTCLAIAASRAGNTPADTYQGTIRYTATPTF